MRYYQQCMVFHDHMNLLCISHPSNLHLDNRKHPFPLFFNSIMIKLSLIEQKSSLISSLEEANTELESKQQGMIRNFDLHKNKVKKSSK